MVHFQNHDLGQGANMALPIWAMFMQKVYADPDLNVSQEDFERPLFMRETLDCESVAPVEKKPAKRKKSDFDDF
jgi:penicillin-binding protein 1A